VNYLYFLQQRTHFIREFYADAASVFIERKRKIAQGEEPFDHGYGEDEPPFLDEWAEAEDALDVLGQFCVSMLSSSLHLYIGKWISELRMRAGVKQLADLGVGLPEDVAYRTEFKKGWINGYRVYCAKLGVDWKTGPSDLTLLEQIVLARNTVQHSTDITSVRARQSTTDATEHPKGFFADESELAMFDHSRIGHLFRPVRLNVTEEKLVAAVDEVDRFCEWFDTQHPMRRPSNGAG